MRVLSYDVPECDDGRQIKYVMRSRLGISHRQLSRLKTTDGMSVNGASVHANHVVHTGDKISLRLEENMERDGSGAQSAIDDMADGGDAHVPSAALNEQVCAALDERYADTIVMLSPSGKSRTQAELAREIVVYEDDDTLIINKPAPLPTGASARQDGITLESVLFAQYGLNGGWQFRPVNRLDKGTSGLLAAARTAHAH